MNNHNDFLRFLLCSWLSKSSCSIRAMVVLKLLRLRGQDYDVTGGEYISYAAVEIHIEMDKKKTK